MHYIVVSMNSNEKNSMKSSWKDNIVNTIGSREFLTLPPLSSQNVVMQYASLLFTSAIVVSYTPLDAREAYSTSLFRAALSLCGHTRTTTDETIDNLVNKAYLYGIQQYQKGYTFLVDNPLQKVCDSLQEKYKMIQKDDWKIPGQGVDQDQEKLGTTVSSIVEGVQSIMATMIEDQSCMLQKWKSLSLSEFMKLTEEQQAQVKQLFEKKPSLNTIHKSNLTEKQRSLQDSLQTYQDLHEVLNKEQLSLDHVQQKYDESVELHNSLWEKTNELEKQYHNAVEEHKLATRQMNSWKESLKSANERHEYYSNDLESIAKVVREHAEQFMKETDSCLESLLNQYP